MSRGPRCALLVFSATAWLAAVPVSAQEAGGGERPTAEGDGGAEGESVQLFQDSAASYREGRFEEAASLLRRAYALRPEPVLLYNLARALEAQGELAGAVDAYERYLASSDEVSDRGRIERRMTELRARIRERERITHLEQALSERAREDPPPAHRSPSVLPWVVAGVGAAGLSTGAVLGLLALGAHDDATGAESQARASDLQDRAGSLALGANVALAVGALLAAVGLTWGVLSLLSGGAQEADAVALRVNATGTSVALVLWGNAP